MVNVEVAIFRGGQWLIIQRSARERHAGGLLAMPGGTVEEYDSPDNVLEACARREVLEEIGVTLGPRLEYVESKLFHSARGRWVINVVFLADYESGDPVPQSPDEVAWAGWKRMEEIVQDSRCPVWLKNSLQAATRLQERPGREKTSADRLAIAAERLFAGYPDLTDTEYKEAVSAFAVHKRPYFDSPRARWLVSSYELSRSVLRDRRLSNDLTQAAIQTNSARLRTQLKPDPPSLLFIDPPEHDLIKNELNLLFAKEALEHFRTGLLQRWRTAMHTIDTAEIIELGAAVVHPICVAAVFDALGLAQPAVDEIPALVDDLYDVNLLFDLNASADQRIRSQAAAERMRRMTARLLPGSAVAERMAAVGVSHEGAVSTIIFMLRAGVVTVGSLLMSMLVAHLSDAATAVNGTSGLDLNALLVRHTPTGDTGRVASEEVKIGDTIIPAGSTIITLISAANAALAAEGKNLAGHLVFGAGIHRCVGERLVRMQAQLAMDAAAETPVRLTPIELIAHRTPSFHGYREILVAVSHTGSQESNPED